MAREIVDMYKKNINRIIWMILIVIIINLAITSKEVIGETIYVDDDGDADYTTIQEGVTNAVDGDTVYVQSGKYYIMSKDGYRENIIEIDKSIHLKGQDKNNTIIDGNGTASRIIRIYANNVTISGFTIKNTGEYDHEAILSDSSYTSIINNIIENATTGIELKGDFAAWDVPIHHNIIKNNIIRFNGEGILLTSCLHNNTITDNTIISNNCGLRFSWKVVYSTVSGNNISQNVFCGIDLSYSSNNTISGNIISSNFRGIQITSRSIDNIISGNIISLNTEGLSMDDWTKGNFIYHNDFVNNNDNVRQSLAINAHAFDNGYPSGGNYWNDYDESNEGAYDNNTDGIIDTPYYPIERGKNKDRYPLKNPFGLSTQVDDIIDSNNDDNKDDTSENTDTIGNDKEEKEISNNDIETPGFEFIVIFIAVVILCFVIRRVKYAK